MAKLLFYAIMQKGKEIVDAAAQNSCWQHIALYKSQEDSPKHHWGTRRINKIKKRVNFNLRSAGDFCSTFPPTLGVTCRNVICRQISMLVSLSQTEDEFLKRKSLK